MRPPAIAALALTVVAVAWLATRQPWRSRDPVRLAGQSIDARAPAGERIRVEVLNASAVRGLGRRATLHLRDRGFDVLQTATATEMRDSVLVLDRSNHPEWARLVADAFGGARIESRPDSSRYLDVTVLVGASWRPPSQPFYP